MWKNLLINQTVILVHAERNKITDELTKQSINTNRFNAKVIIITMYIKIVKLDY